MANKEKRIPLTLLDLISVITDHPAMPMTFGVAMEMNDLPSPEAMQQGWASACKTFPTAGGRLQGRQWRIDEPTYEEGADQTLATDDEALWNGHIEAAFNLPVDLKIHGGIRQRIFRRAQDKGGVVLTFFHHALTDGVGGSLFVDHQMCVAHGEIPPEEEWASPSNIDVKVHPQPVRVSQYAFEKSCEPPIASGHHRSGKRKLFSRTLKNGPLIELAKKHGDFTFTDLMAGAFLHGLMKRQHSHAPSTQPAMGLWIPVNIRQNPLVGFGNGTSRIRVYGRFDLDDGPLDCARCIRKQMLWSKEHGEWGLPDAQRLLRLPNFLLRPLVHLIVNRPGVDYASAPFTHLQRWGRPKSHWPTTIQGIQGVGPLDKRHPLGLIAGTHGHNTHLSLAVDSGLVSDVEAGEILDQMVTRLHAALEPAK